MKMLENTPEVLIGDPRYAEDKTIRDRAWDDWRVRTAAALSPHVVAAMGIQPEMQALIDEGYFVRVAQGDTRAASLFAREVAFRLNRPALPSAPGWLKKGGGQNVDGYAEDAIVLNADPADLMNVVDLVGGTGAPGARPQWNGPLPRRSSDTWEAPRALSAADLAYLRGGDLDPPPPPPPPPPVDLRPVLEALAALDAKVNAAAADARTAAERAGDTKATVENTRTRLEDLVGASNEIQNTLANPPTYVGRVPAFGGTATLRPQHD